MKIREIIHELEQLAPPAFQENYDNSGLIVGNPDADINSILVTLDATEEVVDEAVKKGCNLIVAHHPVIFSGLKKLNGKNYVERTVIKAVKNDVAIYAIHTNLDNVVDGVNYKIASKLDLNKVEILDPRPETLFKLTVFVPGDHTQNLLNALHAAGAGNIGNYSQCSFKTSGTGSFKPNENSNPFLGESGKLEEVKEDRIEVIFPSYLKISVLNAMFRAHPYEEVAYYLQSLENFNREVGSGTLGELPEIMDEQEFLAYLKKRMALDVIKFTPFGGKISKVAICGGSGSFLLKKAMASGADAFVTSDFKYHEFFDAEKKILIADIGHFESEVFTKDLLVDYLSKKIANFAVSLSEVNTNPIKYYF